MSFFYDFFLYLYLDNRQPMTNLLKECLVCGKPLKGRSDKKFCNDYCRNVYNNQAKAVDNGIIRNINNALKKNRQILASLIETEKITVRIHRDQLVNLGFQFKWHTHLYTTQKGATYYFCYDYGYLPTSGDGCLVVRGKETR